MRLLKSRRKELWDEIAKAGVEMSSFTMRALSVGEATEANKHATKFDGDPESWEVAYAGPPAEHRFFFCFVESSGEDEWMSVACPGDNEYAQQDNNLTWGSVVIIAGEWAMRVKFERDAEDPWNVLPPFEAGSVLGDGGENENEPFSAEEAKLIHAKLDELLRRLNETHELGSEERAALGGAIQNLHESTERLTRKEWKAAFLGWFVGLVMNKALATESFNVVWVHVIGTFGHAIKLLGS
jgi:hypothetical protein